MNFITYLPVAISVMGIIAAYINLSFNYEKRAKERDDEIKKYIDKEVTHIRDLYNKEIIHLNTKIDKLIDLVEKLRDKE